MHEGVKALIIDLRDNTGGYVEAATAVADVFVDGGAIYSCEDKYGRPPDVLRTGGRLEIPLAVLQNGASASASEIVAAALRDNCGRAAGGRYVVWQGDYAGCVYLP